ncbi:Holliday junction resolvase-like protein [Terrimonas alba]|uniref:Holliday junction resolvase-like protein n=1 Tax=Terrimonas alba TaxID=3349636 RepID=UPI0035F39B89
MSSQNSTHLKIIQMLKSDNFYIECPCCNKEVPLKTMQLFDNNNFSNEALEIYTAQLEAIKEKKQYLKKLKEVGTTKSERGALSINIGFILERLAPTMGSFRFSHNDCRSLFDPIDYIIFEGLSNNGKVNKVFFVDIKTGNARLTKRQKEIKSVIANKNVNFKIF